MHAPKFAQYISIFPLFLLGATLLPAQTTNVLTWRNNLWRDGLNNTETTLTQANVTPAHFGKICSTAPGVIDGQIFAQPLVVTGSIPGYNHVVYVATLQDSVYFIDGDSTNCAVIKHISLVPANEKPVECTDIGSGQCSAFSATVGILGTPVIDITTNTMYLVSWTESTAGHCAENETPACFVHRLHALDLATGAEKFNGPAVIPTVTMGSSKFNSQNHIQRPGLLILPKVELNGDSAVYVAFSSMDGSGKVGVSVPNGWLFSYDAGNLQTAPVSWTSTPGGEGGGVWMSGAGLAAGLDKPGGTQYLYVTTGDGTFDVGAGGSDYGDSFVKLTPSLDVVSSFTPYNQYCEDTTDHDLGSGGVMLIPNGVASSTTFFALAHSKTGEIYVIDRANPSGYTGPYSMSCPTSGTDLNVETISAFSKGIWATSAFWNQNIFILGSDTPLQKYAVNSTCSPGPICKTPVATTAISYGYASMPVVSSNLNNTGTAVLWLFRGIYSKPQAVLYALDAEHVSGTANIPPLWNSNQCPTRDKLGNSTKFAVPTVANGRVFFGTIDPTNTARGEFNIFGPTTAVCK